MSDYESIWDGRGSLPWQTGQEHWRQISGGWVEREAYNYGDLPTDAEMRRVKVGDRAQDKAISGFSKSKRGRKPSTWTHSPVCRCGTSKRLGVPKCHRCYLGRPAAKPRDPRLDMRECACGRKKRLGQRRCNGCYLGRKQRKAA